MRTKKNSGFSLIELLIVVAIILIIAAIAIPNLLRARITANETSAVGSLRTMNTGLTQYASTYTVGSVPCGFPPALANLAPTGGGAPSAAQADLLDSQLSSAAPSKSGYVFVYVLTGVDTNAPPCGTTYTINANPQTFNTTGNRTFFTDQSGVIRYRTDGAPATVADPPIS